MLLATLKRKKTRITLWEKRNDDEIISHHKRVENVNEQETGKIFEKSELYNR